MNKIPVLFATLIAVTTMSAANQLVLVGTYTPKESTSRGIYAVRLNTATLYPWSFIFKTRFCPITANPINPISQVASAISIFTSTLHAPLSSEIC